MVSDAQVCSRIDDSFGPYAGECRGGFDFTLLFQETILSILPMILLLTLVPFRVAYLLKRERKVNSNLLLPTKLVRGLLLPAMQPRAIHARATAPGLS